MDERAERHRTRVRHRDDPPPPTPTRRGDYDFFLPESYVHRLIWEQAKRQGVQATTREGVSGRPVDAPVTGQVALLPRDEREAKSGKALAYFDMDGDVPIGVVGAGEIAWQELKEIVDEAKHYGTLTPQLPERRDIRAVWLDEKERAWRAKRGMKTTGALPKR
jgi:hypothetical protein